MTAPPSIALVLGSGGMVGPNLTRALIRDGFQTHCAIRPGGPRDRLPERASVHEADLTGPGAVASAIESSGAAVIFNLARAKGAGSDAVNVDLVGALLEAAAARPQPARVVHLGSSLERWDEGDYATAKVRATGLCREAVGDGAPVTVLRPVSLYGPWDSPGRLIPKAIGAALAGRELELTEQGVGRDWLYVGDLVDACLLAAAGAAAGEVVDLGTGVARDNREVAELAARAAGTELRTAAARVAPRPWDGAAPPVSPESAESQLGWRPKVGIEDGLRRTVEWIRGRAGVPVAG